MNVGVRRKSAVAQRLKPAGALAVGLAALGLNVLMLIKAGHFFPFGNLLGGALVLAAGFGVIVGEPEDPYGNRPMWFKAAAAGCAVLGAVVGLLMNVELSAE